MKAQILLTVAGAKHLIAKALVKKLDLNKRIYIAYGSTNIYLLHHLRINLPNYMAGCNFEHKLNVNNERPKPVVLENGQKIDIKDFEIGGDDIFIKGANALWYENGTKHAAVLAADERGGTFGNFYIKAACRGAKVIIPVGHEKLIPFYYPATQNVNYATGNKVALLRFFYGDVYTEIEAFKDLFDLDSFIIASGGILDTQGAVIFEITGKRVIEAVDFAEEFNDKILENL